MNGGHRIGDEQVDGRMEHGESVNAGPTGHERAAHQCAGEERAAERTAADPTADGHTAEAAPEAATGTAGRIRSLREAARVFLRCGSPRILVLGLAAATALRLALAPRLGIGPWDVAAIVVVAALAPFVEWFVHRWILHARPHRVAGLTLDPGVGHRDHHTHAASIHRTLLRAVDALVFQVANAAIGAVVVSALLVPLGAPVAGTALTGTVAALAALLHYEWAHFLFHTAYRPRSARYRRLKANHRAHHWRNDRHWLGITSNLGDRVLGTLPARTGDVPLRLDSPPLRAGDAATTR